MKTRFGFVSNSSSSSFILQNLTKDQKEAVLYHNKFACKNFNFDKFDREDVVDYKTGCYKDEKDDGSFFHFTEHEEFLLGGSGQNWFPITQFFKLIGIKPSQIRVLFGDGTPSDNDFYNFFDEKIIPVLIDYIRKHFDSHFNWSLNEIIPELEKHQAIAYLQDEIYKDIQDGLGYNHENLKMITEKLWGEEYTDDMLCGEDEEEIKNFN